MLAGSSGVVSSNTMVLFDGNFKGLSLNYEIFSQDYLQKYVHICVRQSHAL